MKNKKALGLEFTIMLIVLILLAIVIILFQSPLTDKYNKSQSIDQCRFSVKEQTFAKGVHEESLLPLISKTSDEVNCPIIYETIKEDDDLSTIKKKFADNMASCWYKFNEGDVNLFQTSRDLTNHCVVCSVIDFEKDAAKMKPFAGLSDYMITHKIPRKYGDKYYTEYISSIQTSDETRELISQSKVSSVQDLIDPSKDYLVMLYYPKKDHISDMEAMNAGVVGGTVLGYYGVIAFGLSTGWEAVVIVGSAVVSGIAGYLAGDDEPLEYGSTVMLMPYDLELLNKFECKTPADLGYKP